jgi:hypothetical protein
VKKLQLFKITAALISAATIITISPFITATNYASAESEQSDATVYPQDFFKQLTFTSLSDYAINGDTYAFAQGTSVYIINDEDSEKQLIDHNCGFEIKSLNYYNDTLYLSDADGNYFYIDGTSAAKPENLYNDTSITVGGITYFLEATGSLHCFGNGSLQSVGDG